MRAYSVDLRQRILADCDRGDGTRAVARRFRVSESWVRRLKQRRRETGEIAPRPVGQPKGGRVTRYAEALRALNVQRPDATLAELREALGNSVSVTTIWRALQDLRLSFKKKRLTPPSRTVPTLRPSESSGGSGKLGLTRAGSSSSTKRGRRPI